jgi:hypothetical protein
VSIPMLRPRETVRQIESDVQNRKLARAAERALPDYGAGLATEL